MSSDKTQDKSILELANAYASVDKDDKYGDSNVVVVVVVVILSPLLLLLLVAVLWSTKLFSALLAPRSYLLLLLLLALLLLLLEDVVVKTVEVDASVDVAVVVVVDMILGWRIYSNHFFLLESVVK